ncbi:GTPase ObgE [Balneolales bacterium ANBcel1]|nr:GTPase ObgE [Balneolales bacterium ANBcel1]
MRFADYAKLYLTAGSGGPGMAHFRREKYVPKGGPDGGDGGDGGNIVLEGNSHMNTLLDLRYRKFLKAKKGQPGGSSLKTGKRGEDVVLPVPLGTVAYEHETRRFLGEVINHGDRLVIAKGGKGGLGNANFKTATNQTPQYAQPGEPGEEIVVEIELKLIAEVGLVGFPNAGKSTLLSAVSAARPKIADYPFTTLEPNLGVVQMPDHRSFVMADIPGIIEKAHEGKGLGLTFLRHIERNNVLLFVISGANDIAAEYRILCDELGAYRKDLLDKPRMVAVTHMDLFPGHELEQEVSLDVPLIPVSAVTGHQMDRLKEQIWELLHGNRTP